MGDEDREGDERAERPRPKVVDKRISARGETGEGAARESRVGHGPADLGRDAGRAEAATPRPEEHPPAEHDRGAGAQGTRPTSEVPGAGPSDVWTPEQEAEAMRIAREIAQTPSIEWVVNTAATLANVAQTKLELGAAADAQLAIDALRALLDGLGSRFQAAEAPLRQTLAQLQLGYADAMSAGPPRPTQ